VAYCSGVVQLGHGPRAAFFSERSSGGAVHYTGGKISACCLVNRCITVSVLCVQGKETVGRPTHRRNTSSDRTPSTRPRTAADRTPASIWTRIRRPSQLVSPPSVPDTHPHETAMKTLKMRHCIYRKFRVSIIMVVRSTELQLLSSLSALLAALRSRCGHYIFVLFLSSSSFLFLA